MSAVAYWSFSVDGIGAAYTFSDDLHEAGGLASVSFAQGTSQTFEVESLGNGQVALKITITDANRNLTTLYWNSHFATSDDANNPGMLLWLSPQDGGAVYSSDSIGPEQTFTMTNLGGGAIALQATAGAFPGQYLAGMAGGWYPDQWGYGDGSFHAVSTPAPLQVGGDLLPILLITSSGYRLDLTGRSLGAISLAGSNMQQCTLNGADLSQVTSVQGADFTSALLQKANLGALDLGGATWTGADFTGSDLSSIAAARGAAMTGAVFDGADLSGRDLSSASLSGASFRGAKLTGAVLDGADLSAADFTGATLAGASLRGANLQGTRLDGVDLSTAVFDAVPDFARSATGRTTFQNSTLPFALIGSDWSWLDLTGATLTDPPAAIPGLVADGALLPDGLVVPPGTDLGGASFQGTRMYRIVLDGVNLQGADLRNALLKGATATGANLALANLDSAWLIAEQSDPNTPPDELEAASVTKAFLYNAVLDGAHCDGVDFTGSWFVTAPALGSQPASAVGAFMNFARFDYATLVGARFDGAQLSASSFAAASLVGATFRDNGSVAVELTPSSDVDRVAATVARADLSGADFTGANMVGLNMEGAVVSATGGEYAQALPLFDGTQVPVSFQYGATVLGNTDSSTLCPDGGPGPCSVTAAVRTDHLRGVEAAEVRPG